MTASFATTVIHKAANNTLLFLMQVTNFHCLYFAKTKKKVPRTFLWFLAVPRERRPVNSRDELAWSQVSYDPTHSI